MMSSVKTEENLISETYITPKVPILRGKINLFFFLIFPTILYLFFIHEFKVEPYSFVVYSFCSSFSFVSSITLHWKIWDQERYSLYRKIDYAGTCHFIKQCSGIFLIIGGCGFPAYVTFMKSDYVVVLTLFHWIIILTGVFSSLLFNFGDTSKGLRAAVYVLISLPYFFLMPVIFKYRNFKVILLLSVGGSFYITGAFVYGSKIPNLIPGIFEYHELFHIFCLLGFAFVTMGNFLLCRSHPSSLLNKVLQSR